MSGWATDARRYVWRRLLWTIPTLFGVVCLLFLLLQVLPGDPVRLLTGDRSASKQTLSNLRDRLDLAAPVSVQFYQYLGGLVRGDLGTSYQTRQPVTAIIGATLPNSLRLALLAVVIELVIAVPAGVLAAIKRDTIFDRLALVLSALLIAAPVFLLGLFFQLLFGIKLGWLPVAGAGGGDLANHLMPAAVMGLIAAAYLARVIRSAMLDVLSEDYILAARANGLPTRRVIFVHALKNAFPPALALAGLHFGFLLGSAVATETVFNWPGLGRRLHIAVMSRDRPLIIGAVLVLSSLFLLVNLLVDILQARLNPKVRLSSRAGIDV